MRILITGASGYIGRRVASALAREGHDLVLTSRERGNGQADLQHCEWRQVDFAAATEVKAWLDLVENADVVINAVGIFHETGRQSFNVLHDRAPVALFRACQQLGGKRVVQISALGAEEGATSRYHLSKKKADDALAAMQLDWVIVRPSLIIGDDGASWRFFQALAYLPVIPVIGDGRQLLQPVAIDDVVSVVVAAVKKNEAVGRRFDVVGAETLTLEGYLRSLSRWLGRDTTKTVHIPFGIARNLVGVGRALFDGAPLTREALNMLQAARPYDGKACQSKLGVKPLGLSAFLADHPAHAEQRIAAGQYLLRPLLRLSLGLMWVIAGIVSAYVYPLSESLSLLGRLGLTGSPGLIALYGASLLDVLLGAALLFRYRVRIATLIQVLLVFFYTAVLSWVVPEMWADPFGPLAKNIPIIVATLMMLSWEGKSHA